MDRLSTILHHLRRRDNIHDFIEGLEDSECWPYPDGETRSIAATRECFCCGEPAMMDKVKLRECKLEELTQLYLINVYRHHNFAPFGKKRLDLADVSIELCPEEGPGAYAVSYEVVNEAERSAAPKLDLQEVATIRSAFMHRYEWVVNKFHSVNRDRLNAWRRAEMGSEHVGFSDEEQSEAPLSEEEDYDSSLSSDDGCGEKEESQQSEDDVELVVVKPCAEPASGSSLSFDQAACSDELGCDPAYGPFVLLKDEVVSTDDASSTSISGTTLADSGHNVAGRKRARENSVEL